MNPTTRIDALKAGTAAFTIVLLLLAFQNCGKFTSFTKNESQPPSAGISPLLVESSAWSLLLALGHEKPVDFSPSENSILTPPSSFAFARQPDEEGYDIVIVAGQSNAAGVGRQAVDEPYEPLDSRIFQIRRIGELAVVPATHTLQHWEYPPPYVGVGFGLSFARKYAQRLNSKRKVLIVPAAFGGTSVLKWLGVVEHKLSDGTPVHLYDDMKARVNFAMNQKGSNRVVALLWHQGEADIWYAAQANPAMPNETSYRGRLNELFQKVRADFGEFPILMGEVADDPAAPQNYTATKANFTNMMMSLVSSQTEVGSFGFVRSSGLLSNFQVDATTGDSVHFSSNSQIEFGKRYFEVYRQLVEAQALVSISPQGITRNQFVAAEEQLTANVDLDKIYLNNLGAKRILRQLSSRFPSGNVEQLAVAPEVLAVKGINYTVWKNSEGIHVISVNATATPVRLSLGLNTSAQNYFLQFLGSTVYGLESDSKSALTAVKHQPNSIDLPAWSAVVSQVAVVNK